MLKILFGFVTVKPEPPKKVIQLEARREKQLQDWFAEEARKTWAREMAK